MPDFITIAGNALALLDVLVFFGIIYFLIKAFRKISKKQEGSKIYYLFFASIAAYLAYRVVYLFFTAGHKADAFAWRTAGNFFFAIAGILFFIAVSKMLKHFKRDLDGSY